MKIELPLETWVDVYGFVPRSQLLKLVPNLEESHKRDHRGHKCRPKTIGDRQFVSFIQFFLHKCGQITLGQLTISNDRDGNPAIEHLIQESYKKLPLADVPIPENVTNFNNLWICNTGNSVIRFLQEFQRNSLLNNANLEFSSINADNFLKFMTNFWPLFLNSNIKSVKFDSLELDSIQCEHHDLAKTLLASVRILHTKYNRRDCWLCEWLQTPREDGKPRILVLDAPKYAYPSSTLLHLIRHIKKIILRRFHLGGVKEIFGYCIYPGVAVSMVPKKLSLPESELKEIEEKKKKKKEFREKGPTTPDQANDAQLVKYLDYVQLRKLIRKSNEAQARKGLLHANTQQELFENAQSLRDFGWLYYYILKFFIEIPTEFIKETLKRSIGHLHKWNLDRSFYTELLVFGIGIGLGTKRKNLISESYSRGMEKRRGVYGIWTLVFTPNCLYLGLALVWAQKGRILFQKVTVGAWKSDVGFMEFGQKFLHRFACI